MALVYISPWSDAALWREQVARHLPGEELRVWPEVGEARDIDVALVWKPPHGALATLPRLRLIANLGAGVEHLMADPDLPRHVPMTRLVHPLMTEQMSEYCALGVMMGLRKVPAYLALQRERRWVELEADVAPPSARTVGVLGLGELGADTARKLAALGYRVRGWSRAAATWWTPTCSRHSTTARWASPCSTCSTTSRRRRTIATGRTRA